MQNEGIGGGSPYPESLSQSGVYPTGGKKKAEIKQKQSSKDISQIVRERGQERKVENIQIKIFNNVLNKLNDSYKQYEKKSNEYNDNYSWKDGKKKFLKEQVKEQKIDVSTLKKQVKKLSKDESENPSVTQDSKLFKAMQKMIGQLLEKDRIFNLTKYKNKLLELEGIKEEDLNSNEFINSLIYLSCQPYFKELKKDNTIAPDQWTFDEAKWQRLISNPHIEMKKKT